MATIRTFIAVDVSPRIRSKAGKLIERLESRGADYNWVYSENLHITLNFPGDVNESEIPQLCRVVKSAVEDFASFQLDIRGLGCFPSNAKPKVVWLGSGDGVAELTQLNHLVAEALFTLGFPIEKKPYRPHLTLGRLKRGGQWNQAFSDMLKQYENFDAGRCHVENVIVNSSYLDRAGPSYTALSTIPLS